MRGRYFVGVLLILLGAGFLLDQFGIVSFGELISTYWPSIIILAGLFGLLDRHSSTFGNLIVMAIGVILQLNRLGIIAGDIFRYIFPVILILVGFNLLISKGNRTEYHSYDYSYKKDGNTYKAGDESAGEKGDWTYTSEEFVDRTALMSGIDNINSSQAFKGGRLTAIMGGIKLDLRGAAMAGESCQIEATAIAGGIDIIVPRHWKVEVRGTPILGGFSNKTGIVNDLSAPLLIVKGSAVMGGVEVKW